MPRSQDGGYGILDIFLHANLSVKLVKHILYFVVLALNVVCNLNTDVVCPDV